jgi:hypothetical protein
LYCERGLGVIGKGGSENILKTNMDMVSKKILAYSKQQYGMALQYC